MTEDVCRICRGEETPEEPLYHPCRCSGSIKYVHQDCLLEWLEHARVRTKCDVCGTEYTLRKRYKPGMTEKLPTRDYLSFTLLTLKEKYHVIYYVVRGVLMVSFVAIATKYALEVSVIFTELPSINMAKSEFLSRARQSPPRTSALPAVDRLLSWVIPPSELRSACVNGLLLIGCFICLSLFCWFLAMCVLNEQALLHDIEHIELGEMSHMDQGDDEELLSELYPHNHHLLQEVPHRPQENAAAAAADNFGQAAAPADGVAQTPADQPPQPPPTIVNFQLRSNIYEDFLNDRLRGPNAVGVDYDALAAEEEEEEGAAEEIGVFLRRMIVDLFGGPNGATFRGFVSALIFFGTFAASYPSIYWPSLLVKQSVFTILYRVMQTLKAPAILLDQTRAAALRVPQSVAEHLLLVGTVQVLVFTTIRLSILFNMQMLLKRSWGKTLLVLAYQVYAVLKTLLMTLIETLAFPQYCGFMLHIAFLPLMPNWSWHWEQAKVHPYWTLFVQWLMGYLYMHIFQIFVGACRKFFRKGVLFFLHDNDAVFLMRSMMILSVPKQLRRFAASAAAYGAFIIFGIGTASVVLRGPLRLGLELVQIAAWPGFNCLRLWPFVICGSALFVPLRGSDKPMSGVLKAWACERVWLRMFYGYAEKQDLASWLFAHPRDLTREEAAKLSAGDTSAGYFVRVPVEIPYRPRHSLKLFVPINQNDERLDDKTGVQPNELAKYAICWRPPQFRARLVGMACYCWAFMTAFVCLFTYLPFLLGRLIDSLVYKNTIKNDLLLMAVGFTIMAPLITRYLLWRPTRELKLCQRWMSVRGSLPHPSTAQIQEGALWALFITLLAQAAPHSWHHWLVFDSGKPVATFMLNFLVFAVGNSYSLVWCHSIASADFMIWQLGLEWLQYVPRSNDAVRYTTIALAVYRCWQVWQRSRFAKSLSDFVRETIYLDVIEISNYEGNAQTQTAN